MKWFAAALALSLLAWSGQAAAEPKKWQQGKGWGWVWGEGDQVGALNEMSPESMLKAIQSVKEGRVFDLGVTYDRTSFKWPGHSPGEIITFRSPEGVRRQQDLPFTLPENGNSSLTTWHSSALFINDNVATQIDGLGHVVAGEDNHWYNGFKEEDWGGNWGIRKAGAETIPPIVARGVLIDVAGYKGVDALPAKYAITPADLQGALARQGTRLQFGDVVLIRTGTLRYWGETGADHDQLRDHDSAGIDLAAARWLVEEQGALMIGSDTSGLECAAVPPGSTSFIPVHVYLLIEQGVHIGEFHYLEDLAASGTYEFLYLVAVNKIKGTAAGFTLRPLAIR